MRKLALCVAVASTALASPALARDDAYYIQGGFGALLAEDFDLDLNGGGTQIIGIESDRGYDGSLVLGYDFGGFRLESEVAYKNFDLDTLRTNGVGISRG